MFRSIRISIPSPTEKVRGMSHNSSQLAQKFKRASERLQKTTLCANTIHGGDDTGIWSLLSDDIVCFILRLALKIKSIAEHPFEYFSDADRCASSILNVACTCRRLREIVHSVCPEIGVECVARSCTRTMPIYPYSKFAFTQQMWDELRSCDQLKILKAADKAISLHCAKDCCRHVRRAFNKDLSKGLVLHRPSVPSFHRLLTVATTCGLQCANLDGNVIFTYQRERLSKVGVHGSERTRRSKDVVVRYQLDYADGPTSSNFKKCAEINIDSLVLSQPLTMKTSPCGDFVAFIRATHDLDLDVPTPFSSAFLWHHTWNHTIEIEPSPFEEHILSAQDLWFRIDDKGDLMITVAWSTDFYHQTGHLVGSNLQQEPPRHTFSSYLVDASICDKLEHFESTFPSTGSLMECKNCCDGNKVVTLSKRRDVANGFRCVYLHDLTTSDSLAVTSTYINAGIKGPLSICVSPTADSIAVVCSTEQSLTVNVSWMTGHNIFTPISKIDITPWITTDTDVNDYDDVDWEPMMQAVKAFVGLQFSPCGRFILALDHRPMFGHLPPQHGVVLIDTAMRGKTNVFHKLPLFSVEEQAPRSIQWTKNGFFIMAPGTDENGSIGSRGGSLCLLSSTMR